MSRMKEITAAAMESIFFFPVPRLSIKQLFDPSGSSIRAISGRIVHTINNVEVPSLRQDWTARVSQCFPRALALEELQSLEALLSVYVRGRVARRNPITWVEYQAQLQRFIDASGALLTELNAQNAPRDLAWSKITDTSERLTGNRLDHDDLYPLVSALHGASIHALEDAERQREEEGIQGDYKAPWRELISGLADLFERTGGKVTAAKTLRDGAYAEPSPFVALVWIIMTEAIPEGLSEHDYSKGAIAAAVSSALATWRAASRAG